MAGLFLAEGVRLMPGDNCFLHPQVHNHMRLSIAALNEIEIVTGIKKIALVLERIYSRQGRGDTR